MGLSTHSEFIGKGCVWNQGVFESLLGYLGNVALVMEYLIMDQSLLCMMKEL